MQTACRSILQIAVAALALTAPVATMAADRGSDGGVIVVGHVPGSNAFGAGTIVGINGGNVRILTANHVAKFGTLSVQFDGDSTAVPAHIVAQFPQRDIAVIEATVDPAAAATLHTAPVAAPRSSEAVHIWGSGVDGPAEELAAG